MYGWVRRLCVSLSLVHHSRVCRGPPPCRLPEWHRALPTHFLEVSLDPFFHSAASAASLWACSADAFSAADSAFRACPAAFLLPSPPFLPAMSTDSSWESENRYTTLGFLGSAWVRQGMCCESKERIRISGMRTSFVRAPQRDESCAACLTACGCLSRSIRRGTSSAVRYMQSAI